MAIFYFLSITNTYTLISNQILDLSFPLLSSTFLSIMPHNYLHFSPVHDSATLHRFSMQHSLLNPHHYHQHPHLLISLTSHLNNALFILGTILVSVLSSYPCCSAFIPINRRTPHTAFNDAHFSMLEHSFNKMHIFPLAPPYSQEREIDAKLVCFISLFPVSASVLD